MHNFIGTVFKVLGISLILMLLMDVLLLTVDTITVNNRVESLSLIIRDELSRNNSIPDDIADLFDAQLRDIVNSSNVAVDYKWNLHDPIVVDGVTYGPIDSSHVKDYGEILELAIVVTMEPHFTMLLGAESKARGDTFFARAFFSYDRVYVYKVPALRYLK